MANDKSIEHKSGSDGSLSGVGVQGILTKEVKNDKGPTVKDMMEQILKSNESVAQGLNTVASALLKLTENQSIKATGKLGTSIEDKKNDEYDFENDKTYPTGYVPKKYREIVDSILSPEFGITVHDFEDRMDFQLIIIVPDKFSSVSSEDRKKGILDERSKMISRALGENGVREWCLLIRKNLAKYYNSSGVQSPFKNVL